MLIIGVSILVSCQLSARTSGNICCHEVFKAPFVLYWCLEVK